MLKEYTSQKRIKARPMNRLEYNEYCGQDLPSDENGQDEGYLVEYLGSPNSNHPDHEGYISWSPKDLFEQTHRTVEGLTFGYAIEALTRGKRVSVAGWEEGTYLYKVEGKICIKKAEQGTGTYWDAFPLDMFSEDWVILD